MIIDIKKSTKNNSEVIWEWQPSDSKGLPFIYMQEYFNKIDECKPANSGKEIMITSSTGGVAVIDKESKSVVFYTQIGNPHSIEELPNNIIAVAASNNIEGNCVALYQKNNAERKSFFKDSLFGAHGLFWDKDKQLLYALGQKELRTYLLIDWLTDSPKIQIQKQWNLPDLSGHDLVSHNSNELLITTRNNVWVFDKDKHEFKAFEPIENSKNIKGISLSKTNRIVYVKAEEKWWSHNIYFTNPDKKLSFPNINLYKVRWFKE
ncbi:DUF6528 family protein [Yeosuana marina]|uniref:DUF6528 family protein n=1 Tax=Yeosuana marina TaxID=1565536 RepID=UPI0030EF8272|tara:strand:+ start:340 stop:1128 length:789 start_codon:yes stop_codon:yes gene_type:complete